MGAIQDLFRTHGPDYLARFASRMPAEHRKVIEAIVACGSPALGSLRYDCDACGQFGVLPRCCGNRHCPGCQQHKAYAWLDTQLERQLQYHPHIHYLVPGGAVSSTDGRWQASSPGFYLPVHALSAIFRAMPCMNRSCSLGYPSRSGPSTGTSTARRWAMGKAH